MFYGFKVDSLEGRMVPNTYTDTQHDVWKTHNQIEL